MKQCITVDEQIALLKNHGVSFDLMSEAEAREFLYSRSYFFKIKSYERNYTRIEKDRSTPTLDSTSATSSSCHTSILP